MCTYILCNIRIYICVCVSLSLSLLSSLSLSVSLSLSFGIKQLTKGLLKYGHRLNGYPATVVCKF